MSDKQTTAVVLLVILSLVFYLYNKGRLGQFVGVITGNQSNVTGSQSGEQSAALNNIGIVSNASYQVNGLNTPGNVLNAVYGVDNSQGINVIRFNPPPASQGSNSITDLASIGATAAQFFA